MNLKKIFFTFLLALILSVPLGAYGAVTETQKLPVAGTNLLYVAISSDGTTALMGDPSKNSHQGSAHIVVRATAPGSSRLS